MERIWLKSYPPGMPADVSIVASDSLPTVLERVCERYGDLPAFTNQGATITYDELDAMSRDFAAYLQ